MLASSRGVRNPKLVEKVSPAQQRISLLIMLTENQAKCREQKGPLTSMLLIKRLLIQAMRKAEGSCFLCLNVFWALLDHSVSSPSLALQDLAQGQARASCSVVQC